MLHISKRFLWMISLLTAVFFARAQGTQPRLYELRIYYCAQGKLALLVDRFARQTTKLFEKHGMENVGYWLPLDNKDSALYYILAYPSRGFRDSAWSAFGADPNWIAVRNRYEAAGKIVDSVRSVFMETTDFSPSPTPLTGTHNRLFECRTYTSPPGKLDNLLARFRQHTTKLFTKAGMENIIYFRTLPADGSPPQLLYLLGHADSASARVAWQQFNADPVWQEVKKSSEQQGPIVSSVVSVYLSPLPFSKIR